MSYRADIGDEVYRDRDREVYVEREGMSVGTIIGIVLAVVVVLAIVWFFFLGGMNTGGTTTPNDNQNQITIDQPANPPAVDQPAY